MSPSNRQATGRSRAFKALATGAHPKRNEQFEKIEQLKQQYPDAGNLMMSMDT